MRVKFDAPHQPTDGIDEHNVVELFPGQSFEHALDDLAGFDRIWLIWWFHKNDNWRPKVLPPRGTAKRRGVFATRSPHRPNPIGMTAVPLLGIKGRKLYIGNCDLVDGTPILDIKPYLSSIDSFPDAGNGWLGEVEASLSLPPEFNVVLSPLASEQIDWLQNTWNVDFMERAMAILSRDPSPHRTRRITRCANGQYRIGCGAWRILFSVKEKTVLVNRATPGYPPRLLEHDSNGKVPDREAQIAFRIKWPDL